MAETIKATWDEYEKLMRRHAELKTKLGEIGQQLQVIGKALEDGPEWVRFSGNVPLKRFEAAAFFNPKPLNFDEIHKLVEELRDVYPRLEAAYNNLGDYSASVKDWPRPSERPEGL